MAGTNSAGIATAVLAIEKFDQFRDHLVRRFFHQPMSPVFDQYALDVRSHHLALLDQERTAGFFSRKPEQRHLELGFCETREILGVFWEGAENLHPGGHVAGLGIGISIKFAIVFRNRILRIGGKIIPEMLKINPLTPRDQRQRSLAVEMEMPEIAQQKDAVPVADTRQERLPH